MARKIKIEELQALIEKEEYIHVEGTLSLIHI